MKEMEDTEFKTTVIRFFKNFLEKADKFSETLEDMREDRRGYGKGPTRN